MLLQVSVVQGSLSSQSPLLLQQSAIGVFEQAPVEPLQVSVVQGLESSQSPFTEQAEVPASG